MMTLIFSEMGELLSEGFETEDCNLLDFLKDSWLLCSM